MSHTGHTNKNLHCWKIMTTFLLEAIKVIELNTRLKEELTKYISPTKILFFTFPIILPYNPNQHDNKRRTS